MATPAQIAANRLNSQKSTGPRSAEGKDAVRFNALKHGADARSAVIPGEDPDELEALSRAYYDQFQPVGPIETFLVETIIRADWSQRRLRRMENEMLNHALEESEDATLGSVFLKDAEGPNALEKIFRRQYAAHRAWFRATTELRRLQQERIDLAIWRREREQPSEEALEPDPELAAILPALLPLPAAAPSAPFQIGFVPPAGLTAPLARKQPWAADERRSTQIKPLSFDRR